MVIERTIKTLFRKPVILLLSVLISLVPTFLAAIFWYVSSATINAYYSISSIFGIIFMLLFMGPLAVYVYETCNDSISENWFSIGLFKKTLKILPVLVITRLIIPIITSSRGIFTAGIIYFGAWVIFIWAIGITFEAVAQVSIGSTESFTDAIDQAVGVTKNIYVKIALISLLFTIIQAALFAGVDEPKTAENYNPILLNEQINETAEINYFASSDYKMSVIFPNILAGVFSAFKNAFILVYCGYQFTEVKQMRDSAMARLNNM